MAKKNNVLGLFFKVAKNTQKQYQKAQKEALKQQKQHEKLQEKIRKEKERKEKRMERAYEHKRVMELKEQAHLLSQKNKQEIQRKTDEMNTKIHSLLSDENKEEIQNIKNIISQFYSKWSNQILTNNNYGIKS